MKRPGIVLQARTGSARLPGKVLKSGQDTETVSLDALREKPQAEPALAK